MRKILGVTLLLLSLAAGAAAQEERTITTTGRGVIDAVPDMATIDIGVAHQARAAREALDLTSAAMAEVIARLETAGIAARDMQTQGLSLQPVWSRQNNGPDAAPRITGYVARNGLMVRVRELENLGQILDEAVEDGANTFNGLQFSLQDMDAALSQARTNAVKDAMAKAAELAEAAGVTLGPVQSITDSASVPRPVMMEMASTRMAADVPVAAGEVSMSVQVAMVFAISD